MDRKKVSLDRNCAPDMLRPSAGPLHHTLQNLHHALMLVPIENSIHQLKFSSGCSQPELNVEAYYNLENRDVPTKMSYLFY